MDGMDGALAPTPRTPADPRLLRGIDRVLSIQRPVVVAHLKQLRRSRPDASPAELLHVLELRYLAAVTTGGAGVGVAASFPGIGTGISVALSSVETAGFIETTTLFAQSVAELHGIAIDDPVRARTLVMTMILGQGGLELLEQLARQASGHGLSRNAYWGEVVAKNLPGPAVAMIADRLKQAFLKRFAISQGGSIVGRTIPFGVGAVIGGAGNHVMARRVVKSALMAFGPVPEEFPESLRDEWRTPNDELVQRSRLRRAVGVVLPVLTIRDAIGRGIDTGRQTVLERSRRRAERRETDTT